MVVMERKLYAREIRFLKKLFKLNRDKKKVKDDKETMTSKRNSFKV
jgi:hypothetical protein